MSAAAAENSAKNFTSTRGAPSPPPPNFEEGSSPRSSEGIYPLFSAKSTPGRLLNVPASAASAAATASAVLGVKPAGTSWFRYFVIICILIFLGLNVFLYLDKPADASISQLYDPVLKWLGYKTDEDKANQKLSLEEQERENKAIKKMYKKEQREKKTRVYKKEKPVAVPEPDDSLQMKKSKSKAGFCYIGEDRGFRSCIEVGEGEVCMSGDIFPTEDVCINPKLRI
jgi:hypothetical protein